MSADNPMTRDDDRNRIVPDRAPDRLSRHRRQAELPGQLPGDFPIRRDLTLGNFTQAFPHRLPEFTSPGRQS